MNQNKHDNDLLIFLGCMAIILAATLAVAFGAIAATFDPRVTQFNLSETVCNHAWVQAQRPPVSYTQEWEKANGGGLDTVVDHKAPICAGGDAKDYANYQLQATAESYKKDATERLVCRLLCEGKLTLKQAQRMFWQ